MAAGELVADRYQMLEAVGSGGMGEVWRCHDLALDRPVALKRLRSDLGPAARSEVDQLFYREAAALASVTHPNLVRAFDFGFLPDGARYLVMGFVEGVSLERVWERQAVLDWHLLGWIIDQILAGLAHLHARGLVHRDLKPANVMLGEGPRGLQVTILDLGVAAFREVAILDIMRPLDEPLPEIARYATPPYCAPEQLLRHAMFLGPTTDLHAVGVLLYQFCAGRLPFAGRDEGELFEAVLRRAPEPLLRRNDAPAELDPILDQLLAKRPWHRYDFAVLVRRELEKLWDPARARRGWDEVVRRHGLRPVAITTSKQKPHDVQRLAPSSLLALQLPALFGREREQTLLAETAAALADNQSRLIALVGEAGVGKSRLAQWLMELVHEQGLMHALRISFGRAGGALSGVLGALERHFGFIGAPAEIIERALTTRWGRDEEARLLARGLAAVLRPSARQEDGPAGIAVEQGEQRIELFARTLQRIAGDRPLLLWIDDVQRADEETLALATMLLDSSAPPALILATGRIVAEDEQPDRLASLCARQGCDAQVLAPLGRAPLRTLLASLLRPPGQVDERKDELDEHVLDVLYRACRGNPLFAVQQIQAWKQRAQIWWQGDRRCYGVDDSALAQIAVNTDDLWRDQLEALDASLQLAAVAATTLGSTFDRAVLHGLLEGLSIETSAVFELVRQRMLVPERNHLFWYHETLEEHLAAQLARHPEAVRIHGLAADVLARHSLADTRAYVLLIVRNLLAAGRIHEACDRLLSFVEEQWERRRVALHAHEDLDLIETYVQSDDEGRFLRCRSRAAWARCDFEAAEAAAALALDWAEARGEEAAIAAAQGLLGEVEKGRGGYEAADRWFRAALTVYQRLDRQERVAQISLLLAQGEHYMARYDKAEGWVRQALRAAEVVGAEGPIAEAWWWLAWVLHDRGRYDEAQRWASSALTSFEKRDNPQGMGQAHWLLATICGQQALLRPAAQHLATAQQHFEQAGERWWLLASALMQAWLANITGSYREALAVAAEVRRLLEGLGTTTEIANAHLATAAAHLAQGETQEAEAALEAARALAPPEPSLHQIEHLLRAWLAVTLDAWEAAEDHLRRALAIWRELGLTAWAVPWQLSQLERRGWPPDLQQDLRAWVDSLRVAGTGEHRRIEPGQVAARDQPPPPYPPDGDTR